jgi:hypothetical protein
MAAKDILRKVRLVFDKASGRQVEEEAKRNLSGVERGMARLKKAALALGSALAAAFAVRKIIAFGKEVVRVAAESEEIWNRLGYAVENVGVSFDQARPEIEAFARAMQDATTVGDEDFAAVLTELITTSGDYAASLNAVGTVADLAAAKQLDLRTAAQLVGRALIGETGTFKRYGIVIKEGETAMEALRRSFGGFAENEAKTLGGRLKQLGNEWSDFKQAVGEALIVAGGGTSVLEMLAGSLKVLSQWVTENREVFALFGESIAALGNPILRLIKFYAMLSRANATFVSGQVAFLDFLHLGTERMKERAAAVNAWADSLDRLIFSMEEEARRREAGIVLPPDRSTLSGFGTPAPSEDTGSVGGTETKPWDWRDYRELMLRARQSANEFGMGQADGWAVLNSEMEMSAENAAKLADQVGGVADAAVIGQRELLLMNAAAEAGGTLIAGIFGGNIGELAAWKAKQNAIMAAEELAMAAAAALIPGMQGAVGGHLAAAKLFGGIAAAWGALAGATGGFAGGGGGNAGRGGPRDIGGAASERTEAPGPEVHIYMEGDFDALNPRVQRVVAGAIQYSGETYGPNARVTLHRRGRR